MIQSGEAQPAGNLKARLITAGALVLLAGAAIYRAWFDMVTIAWQDPEQSQVLLALPVTALLLIFRADELKKTNMASSLYGTALVAAGWAMSWYGYMHAVQTFWHLGAVAMIVGAAWSVLGNRAMLIALPAIIAMLALVPVPNAIRQEIAHPLQRMTAAGAEFLLIAFGFSVERMGQTLFYEGKPVTIEEACNGMRMVFALLLVCYGFAMAYRLTPFARVILIGVSPLLAVLSNIVRVVPTVVIYGRYDESTGDLFHDLSGWGMIVISILMLFGLIRVLRWAEVPIYAEDAPLPQYRPTR